MNDMNHPTAIHSCDRADGTHTRECVTYTISPTPRRYADPKLDEAVDHLADQGIVAGDDDAHAIRTVLDALELRQLREDYVRALAEATLERRASSGRPWSDPWATALARQILATVGRQP